GAGAVGRRAGGAAAARARRRRDAPGADRGGRTRAAAGPRRDGDPVRLRRRLPRARAPRARPPRRALEARGPADTAVAMSAGAPVAAPRGARTFGARLRSAAWLGWQIESNWADPFVFVVYALLRPLATALILAGMYWAVSGQATRQDRFPLVSLGNSFHIYVTKVLVGRGWLVVEEREEYETLKYVYASPIGMFTYLAGRSSVKMVLATLSTTLVLLVGWFLLGLRWDWGAVAWGPLL